MIPYIHINRPSVDYELSLWCPYCDKAVLFACYNYYGDCWCTECKRHFPFKHQWPKGFDITTGELEQDK